MMVLLLIYFISEAVKEGSILEEMLPYYDSQANSHLVLSFLIVYIILVHTTLSNVKIVHKVLKYYK